MSKQWKAAVAAEETGSGLPHGSEWEDSCNDRCTTNSSSRKCCESQVESEQTQLQSCMAGCGQWAYGDDFPIGYTGIEGDSNDLPTRIKFGKQKCCSETYYPTPDNRTVEERLGYDPRHQPWGWGPKY